MHWQTDVLGMAWHALLLRRWPASHHLNRTARQSVTALARNCAPEQQLGAGVAAVQQTVQLAHHASHVTLHQTEGGVEGSLTLRTEGSHRWCHIAASSA